LLFLHSFVEKEFRKGAGVVELARLESVYTARYRGFESLSFRIFKIPGKMPGIFCFWPMPNLFVRRRKTTKYGAQQRDFEGAVPVLRDHPPKAGNPNLCVVQSNLFVSTRETKNPPLATTKRISGFEALPSGIIHRRWVIHCLFILPILFPNVANKPVYAHKENKKHTAQQWDFEDAVPVLAPHFWDRKVKT
jgi:hypothetical protein